MARTEWEDILIEKGITEIIDKMDLPPPESVTYDISQRLGDESETESDLDNDDFFETYKNKRINELRNSQKTLIREITKSEFVSKVTDGSKGGFVALFLFDQSERCSLYLKLFQDVCNRNSSSVDFYKIVAQECIPNYPSKHLPTVLIYGYGELCQRLVGNECDEIEKRLIQLNAIKVE